ncbi:MAG: hypothetical protein SEPTF4163_000561 [Sporothrix epigloea]
MSSPAQGGPSAPKEKKAGVGSRVLTRMKTIMKKTEKRMSVSGPRKADTSPATPAAAPAEATKSAAVVASNDAPTDKIDKNTKESPETIKIPRTQLYEDRARKLGERFGLEIKPSEWHSTEGDALRVNKPIRMRVHRTCHKCNTDFGTAKECTGCKHVRCKLCTRYPAKRNETEKQEARERRALYLQKQKENAPIIADWDFPTKPMVLTKPSKTGGQVLTARETPKKDKYPYGYPGDEFGTRSIPRFRCHECKTKYPVEAAEGTSCIKCSHPRCTACPRLKPQRVEPDPDPEILKTIEARLSKLRMG